MFCPKCGQEQASGSVRYCLRCGFKLNGLEEALSKRLFVIAMYLGLTTCAIFGWGSFTSGPNYMELRVIITVFAATTFYLLFQRDLRRIFDKLFSKSAERIKQVISPAQQSALPSALNLAAPTFGSHPANTGEIVQPPSITEHTTILLDENKR
jgi:hypothetical protein